MLWLCMCMFRVGTVELREAGGNGSRDKDRSGSGEFLEEKIVDLGKKLLCIFLNGF